METSFPTYTNVLTLVRSQENLVVSIDVEEHQVVRMRLKGTDIISAEALRYLRSRLEGIPIRSE
jgi:hypothetical protein